MGIIDIIFICIIALGFISGLQKGLLASFLACVALAAAWFVASATYPQLASIMKGSQLDAWLVSFEVTDAKTAAAIFNCVSFALIFYLGYAAMLLLVNFMNNVLRFPQLRVFDGLLGGIFGIVRAALLVLVAIAAIKLIFSPVNASIVEKTLSDSVIGGMVKDIDVLKSLHF